MICDIVATCYHSKNLELLYYIHDTAAYLSIDAVASIFDGLHK
jgi:hypothetical protein